MAKKNPFAGFNDDQPSAARPAEVPKSRVRKAPTDKPGPPVAATEPPAPAPVAAPKPRTPRATAPRPSGGRPGRAIGTQRLTVDVPTDELEAFRAKCREGRDPQTLVLRVALQLLQEASSADYERIARDLTQP